MAVNEVSLIQMFRMRYGPIIALFVTKDSEKTLRLSGGKLKCPVRNRTHFLIVA